MNSKALCDIFRRASLLASRKNADYGDGNIVRFGESGVVIRMADKMARLENLILNDKAQSVDEQIEDTCLDLINYAAYLIMLKEGTFVEDPK